MLHGKRSKQGHDIDSDVWNNGGRASDMPSQFELVNYEESNKTCIDPYCKTWVQTDSPTVVDSKVLSSRNESLLTVKNPDTTPYLARSEINVCYMVLASAECDVG